MASSAERATVFVRLLDEGTDVWRPVDARRLGEATYQIADQTVPEDETWSFQPGDIVVAERRQDDAEDQPLIAVAQATHFDEPSWASRRRFG
ncbi:hypothetical protein ACETK8_02960 [Brevundimonas staleyi]|uniref:Uncharacterized protein n=1 Tax=Brevundimonas staleyi TaxID=74326 RepID=A0ABW0FXC0_9CAUL